MLTMANERGSVGIGWIWERERGQVAAWWMDGGWRWMDGRLGWSCSRGRVVFVWSGVEWSQKVVS